MEKNRTLRLARALRVLVTAALALNLMLLLLVPGFAVMIIDGGDELVRKAFVYALNSGGPDQLGFKSLPLFFANCLWAVWLQLDMAVFTVVLWLCGACVSVMLFQARRVLGSILDLAPFRAENSRRLSCAAVCCWVISAAALVLLVLWLMYEGGAAPLFSYLTVSIPVSFMAGLLFFVMSALFRQAAELKEESDLTI